MKRSGTIGTAQLHGHVGMIVLGRYEKEWCEMFRAEGLAIIQPERVVPFSNTPPLVTLQALGSRFESRLNRHEPWFTHRAEQEQFCGGLVFSGFPGVLVDPVPLGGNTYGWLVLLRTELVATHAWAGMPETARQPRHTEQLESAATIHDRWCEEVAGSCEPWEDIELSAAMDLAEDLSVVATAHRIQELNKELQRNQEALREASENWHSKLTTMPCLAR